MGRRPPKGDRRLARHWFTSVVAARSAVGKGLHSLPGLQHHVFRDHDIEQIAIADFERGLNIKPARNQHCANRVRLLAERGRQDLRRVDVAIRVLRLAELCSCREQASQDRGPEDAEIVVVHLIIEAGIAADIGARHLAQVDAIAIRID
jgi:hypothetical protein